MPCMQSIFILVKQQQENLKLLLEQPYHSFDDDLLSIIRTIEFVPSIVVSYDSILIDFMFATLI